MAAEDTSLATPKSRSSARGLVRPALRGLRRPLPVALALLVAAVLLAGCGGKSDTQKTADALITASDQADVASAQVKLAKDAIDGGNLSHDSQQLLETLRTAAADGVAASWINHEIDSAESVVTDANCGDCFSIIDGARQ